MTNITIRRPANFCEEFLSNYLAGGLGKMQKRDIDVLVMHLLISDGRYKFPKDLYKAARELSLTEARVRNLYQEVQLRYQQLPEEDAKAAFVDLINKRSFELKGNRLVFVVRDPMLGQWFQEWVARVDGFTDSSFNSNLVSVNKEVLLDVLDNIAANEFPEFENELDAFNEAGGRKATLELFIDELVKAAGKKAGALGATLLAKVLAGFFGIAS